MSNPVNIPDPSKLEVVDPETMTPQEAGDYVQAGTLHTLGEINLTLVIIFFGIVALAFFYFLVRGGKASEFILRIYVIIVLVIGTLLVVSSSYATAQIAPIVGFFGTIAGYLLGKSESLGDSDG